MGKKFKRSKISKSLDGIDAILEKLSKSEETDPLLDEDEEMDKEEQEVEVSEDEEVEKSEEDDDEVEKSEEDDEEIDKSEDEEDDEEIEKSDDEDFMDFDEVLEAVTARLSEKYDAKIGELTDSINRIVETMGKQTEAIEKTYNQKDTENEEIAKSLDMIEKKLNKISLKKSITSNKDITLHERFSNNVDLSKLTKGQVATILADAFEAGNRQVSHKDITNAEIGMPLSKGALEVLKTALK